MYMKRCIVGKRVQIGAIFHYLLTNTHPVIHLKMFKMTRFCGNSSVGRALPCQGKGRGFESRFPLQNTNLNLIYSAFVFKYYTYHEQRPIHKSSHFIGITTLELGYYEIYYGRSIIN